MNGTLRIHGGRKLKGEVIPIPNKNAIVATLPACILSDEPIVYYDLPDTSDVQKILNILRKLGADVVSDNLSKVTICCKNVKNYEIDYELGSQFRASIMFAGPLLARFGKVSVPMPGGCVLGARSIAAHIDSFHKVGIKVEYKKDNIEFIAPKKPLKDELVWQTEASVTATENVAMYLAGVLGRVTIINAASEPHVSQLLQMLQTMGARIDGIGSNRITIEGSSRLGTCEYHPEPDQVDIAGFIVAAAITKGKIKIKGANKFDIVGGLLNIFEKFNIAIDPVGEDLLVDGSGDIWIDLESSGFPLAGKDLPKLNPQPWPSFPVDVLPVMATLACKMDGKLLLQNWMYETGLDFIRELNKLGANIFMCDPQRVIVNGPIDFKGGDIVSPGIIQACKAIFLAALCDDVVTTLHGTDVLKRRYPDIVTVYKGLGADIEEVKI